MVSFGVVRALLLLGLLDKLFSVLARDVLHTKFPHPVIGLLVVFAVMLQLKRVPASTFIADSIDELVSPGVKMLQAWLPLFYVPNLIVFPLLTLPSLASCAKLLVIVIGGLVCNLLLVGSFVQATRNAAGVLSSGGDEIGSARSSVAAAGGGLIAPPPVARCQPRLLLGIWVCVTATALVITSATHALAQRFRRALA